MMFFSFSKTDISKEVQIWSNAEQCNPSTLSARSVIVENTTQKEH